MAEIALLQIIRIDYPKALPSAYYGISPVGKSQSVKGIVRFQNLPPLPRRRIKMEKAAFPSCAKLIKPRWRTAHKRCILKIAPFGLGICVRTIYPRTVGQTIGHDITLIEEQVQHLFIPHQVLKFAVGKVQTDSNSIGIKPCPRSERCRLSMAQRTPDAD